MKQNDEKSAKVFNNFMWKEMLLSNGLTNGVINGVIYLLLIKEASTSSGYLLGTFITNIVLGVILMNLYPVLIKSKLKKNPGIVVPYIKESHLLANLYPKNTAMIKVINIIACIVISTIFTMGIISCLNLLEIGTIIGAVFRGIDCAVFSVFAYYFSVLFYPKENQSLYSYTA